MVGRIKRLLRLTVLLFLVLSLLATGCANTVSPTSSTPAVTETPVYTVTSAPSSEMKVELSLSGSPMLGQPVEVTATFGLPEPAKSAAANTIAQIVLSDGIELVSGKLDWEGDVLPGTRYEIKATIKAIKYGDWKIEARAFFFPDERTALGGTAYFYALVYPDSATISPWPTLPPGETPIEQSISPPTEKPPATAPGEGNITPGPPPLLPSSDLPTGGVTFINPLVITGGFSANISENSLPQPGYRRTDELQPLIWAWVTVFNASTNQSLGTALTSDSDNVGSFTITVENPYPHGFYVQRSPASGVVRVIDPRKTPGSAAYYYKSQTPTFYPTQSQSYYDIGWWWLNVPDYAAAWRIYETIVADYYDRGAWDFLANEGPAFFMDFVTVKYPSSENTSYSPQYDHYIHQIRG